VGGRKGEGTISFPTRIEEANAFSAKKKKKKKKYDSSTAGIFRKDRVHAGEEGVTPPPPQRKKGMNHDGASECSDVYIKEGKEGGKEKEGSWCLY